MIWHVGALSLLGALMAYVLTFFLPKTADLQLPRLPAEAWLYFQALYSAATKKVDHQTALHKVQRMQVSLSTPITINKTRLAGFLRLAEYSSPPAGSGQTLPIMYPVVECFRLIIQAMVLPAFPFSVLGCVLTRHTSTLLAPITVEDRLTFRVVIEPEGWRTTAKGDTEVDMVSEAVRASDQQVVWRAVTTAVILNPKRNKTAAAAGKQQAPAPPTAGQWESVATWRVRDNVGRAYGLLNGDLNPIHLHAFTARLFGFRRPIAHALYLVARAEASLRAHGVAPPQYPVEFATEFHRPTLLPATLQCVVQPAPAGGGDHTALLKTPGGKLEFAVLTEDKSKPVITGRMSCGPGERSTL